MIKWLWLILAVAVLAGCGPSDEHGFKSSRQDDMRMLKESLDNEGIPYTVADDGFIMYSGKYRDDVERIKKSLEEKRFKEVGIQFEDEATTKYFRTLLDERGIKYRTVPEKDGEWTYWLPENEQQLDELYQKAISHDCETGNERKDSN